MAFQRELDFFQISTQGIDFPAIIEKISKLPRNDTKEGKILLGNNFAIALTDFKNTTDTSEGIIVRLRMSDIPRKGNLIANKFEKLELGKNEGLAEETFFFYSKELNILCLLSAKNGVKCGTFSYYIETKAKLNDFYLKVILSPHALELFRKMKSITSIAAELYIQQDSSPQSEVVQELPLGSSLDAINEVGAIKIKIELYNPKKKGGLKYKAAQKLGYSFNKLGGIIEPKHIRIRGSEDSDYNDQVIDLISQRHKMTINLGKSGGRHLDFEECRGIVKQKIEENKKELQELTK